MPTPSLASLSKLLPDQFLPVRRIARTLNRNVGDRRLNLLQILDCQHNVDRASVFLEPVQLGGSRDGHDPRLLGKQPGQSKLGGSHMLSCSDSSQHVDQRTIRLAGFGCKARYRVAEVSRAKGRLRVDGTGQKTLAKWAERNKPDTQFFEQG